MMKDFYLIDKVGLKLELLNFNDLDFENNPDHRGLRHYENDAVTNVEFCMSDGGVILGVSFDIVSCDFEEKTFRKIYSIDYSKYDPPYLKFHINPKSIGDDYFFRLRELVDTVCLKIKGKVIIDS